MKYFKLTFSIVLFLAICFIGVQVISNSKINQTYKRDAAELNHFKYGLFSVDSWKQQVSIIIADEIDKLYLTRKNEKALKSHLESQLEILIDKIHERIKEKNSKSTKGRFKQTFIESFVDVEEIKKGIPEYAEAMLAEMSSPKAEAQIKKLLKTKITHYMKETFDALPKNSKDQIIIKYMASDEKDANLILQKKIIHQHQVISEEALIIIVLALLLFLLEAFRKKPLVPTQYFILTLTLLVLLAVGVTTPMIDMEAKISHLSFVLFDHPIQFRNQVLYFQSKSILDVFWIMITHKEIQMKLVGILMVCFSIVFPMIKMFSAWFYYYDFYQARKNRLIQFFVLKSGKWSMADVVVVAIFMAYIGFNGIINSQLSHLSSSTENLEILTTNGTNLQPGFYLFFTYTILAMFLSEFLIRNSKEEATHH